MADLDLVIRGGTVVTATDMVEADIGIRGETIAVIGRDLGRAGREIDAKGKLVMPGGIDSHCHIEQPSSTGGVNAESFLSGTRSAACGGTTTVISFSPQFAGVPLKQSTADYHARAERGATIDYTFHLIINDPSDAVVADLEELIASGHRSIKIFMTYPSNRVDDAGVLKLLACARRNRAFVVIHAEHHEMILWMQDALTRAGLTAPKHHAWSKPPLVEREATHRVIAMAELLDQPIQIFHVTCAEAAEEIRRAQERGLKIFGETCTQYLVLTADDMDRPGTEGAKFVCSPSPRTTADQEALWRYIKAGVLGIVSSDHAPTNYGVGNGLKLPKGPETAFTQIPNGVPGLETRLPVLFHKGVGEGRIDPTKFVEIGCTNPAKLFGIYPQKGTIAVGSDADIAIWDPDLEVTIAQDHLHHDVNYTVYEGMRVKGWPVTTLARGEPIWHEGRFTAEPGRGRFLARPPYDYVAPLGRFPTPFDPFG